MYKGVTATAIIEGTHQAVCFPLVAEGQKQLAPFIPYRMVNSMVSGAFAAFVSTTITHPVDVVKTKMQGLYTGTKYNSIVDCLRTIFREHGLMGFFMGVKPRLARVMTEKSIVFGLYH